VQRPRLALALALTVLASGAAYWRARALEPHLDIIVRRELKEGDRSIYEILIEVRGGEPLERVAVEVLRGPVGIAGTGEVRAPPPGTTFKAIVTVSGVGTVPAAIRIVQTGRIDRFYDVDLEEWRLR